MPVAPFSIAFAAPNATRAPTGDEYARVTQITALYFDGIYAARYATYNASDAAALVFVQVNLTLDEVRYEAGIPSADYNIYMAFASAVEFGPGSAPLPSAADLFTALQNSIGTTYIVDYVWQVPDSPFASTQDAVLNPLVVAPPSSQMAAAAAAVGAGQHHPAYAALQGRFVLPGSKIPIDIFRTNEGGTK